MAERLDQQRTAARLELLAQGVSYDDAEKVLRQAGWRAGVPYTNWIAYTVLAVTAAPVALILLVPTGACDLATWLYWGANIF